MTHVRRSHAGSIQAGAATLTRRWALLCCLAGGSAGAAEGKSAAAPVRAPVVLELFTSEGCSSCPPADELLAQLDAAGEVGGAKVIALELHVDYWDYLGWRDPFSAADFTARQGRYASGLGQRTYTPQLVIDGQAEVIGASRAKTMAAIAVAAQRKSPVAVVLRRQGDRLAVQVAGRPPGALVLLAITERGLVTKVLRGENAGQTLRHGPVVRVLRTLAAATASEDRYSAEVPLQLAADWQPDALRAVVLVQAADGHILGAATLPLGKS